MGTGTAGEASRAGTRAIRRDRLVQRTIELTEPEIAAVEAAEMASEPDHPAPSAAKQDED
ncbi:hypothetical protein [uncultured Bradyrhizobium sp.]|uniref:hypothetical protein n=1 Tax=uncultured Bradyrhizobium sp. TaxID=199684 RepID=UPI0026184CB8|nr:hypothetical protein [uncultured Bradyrhizobium sp.]